MFNFIKDSFANFLYWNFNHKSFFGKLIKKLAVWLDPLVGFDPDEAQELYEEWCRSTCGEGREDEK